MKRKFNVLDGNKDISLTIFRLRVCLCVCVSLCLSESRARVCSLYAVTSSVIFYSTYAQKMMYSVSLNDCFETTCRKTTCWRNLFNLDCSISQSFEITVELNFIFLYTYSSACDA